MNFEKVETDYRLKHNDLLANIVHRFVYFLLMSSHFIKVRREETSQLVAIQYNILKGRGE